MHVAFAGLVTALASLTAEPGRLPDVSAAFHAEGTAVHVAAGEYLVAGEAVSIAQGASLEIRAGDVAEIAREELRLPDVEPSGYWNGAQLAGPRTVQINALGSFIESSLVVRDSSTGRALEKGKDYRVSAPFALLGLGTDTDLTPETPVQVAYKHYLQRIDSIVCDQQGRVSVVEGAPVVAEPLPPDVGPGFVRLANVYRPYGSQGVLPEHLYPILSTAEMATTRTTPGRIPRTLEKIQRGDAVTIVCLGDSITAGGDATTPERSFVERFASGLRGRFPDAPIRVVNVSMGGTRSAQWLHNGRYPGTRDRSPEQCTFDRVVRERPDLVVVEFLNDMTLPPADLPTLYQDLLRRVKALDAELALIAPGFSHPSIMGATTLGDADSKPFVPLVRFLHGFAEEHSLAFVDVAGRWEHLAAEGLPYMTLLRNQYNHPGDRGHDLYAQELLRCFE